MSWDSNFFYGPAWKDKANVCSKTFLTFCLCFVLPTHIWSWWDVASDEIWCCLLWHSCGFLCKMSPKPKLPKPSLWGCLSLLWEEVMSLRVCLWNTKGRFWIDTRDGHVYPAMSDICRLMHICGHVGCAYACWLKKSDVGLFFTHFCQKCAKMSQKLVNNVKKWV